MEAGDLPAGGLNPGEGAAGVLDEREQITPEVGDQDKGQIIIKESFCVPWVEDPATFDPAQAGWERAAKNVSAKIQEMLAAPEVTLTPDGLTPRQAAAKEQEDLLAQANARAAKLAEELVVVRRDVEQAAAEAPANPEPVGPPEALAGIQIDQLVEASGQTPAPATETLVAPSAPEPAAAPEPETGGGLDRILEQLPAEVKAEIEERMAEFGENFDEQKFSHDHPDEYTFINQVISESGDPEKAAEAAGKVKARLDDLDKREDGGKKKKDFLVNLFGMYRHRLSQETDPEKKQEIKKSMLGLHKEMAGLGIGSLGGLLEVIIGAIVGEVQEQLK